MSSIVLTDKPETTENVVSLNDQFPVSDRSDSWRHQHLGRRLGEALRRFDNRVLVLMAHDDEVPLALANLATRQKVGAAHIHITRHLDLGGTRLTELAARANMSKQAMADLVAQCEAWGLVRKEADTRDGRAKIIRYTALGLAWHGAFGRAIAQAEEEFKEAVGEQVAAVIAIGLDVYAS